MNEISLFIRDNNNYKQSQVLMKFFFIDSNDKEISLISTILYEKLKPLYYEDKIIEIMGKKVKLFIYNNRKGDIMIYLSKYIIITLYPMI